MELFRILSVCLLAFACLVEFSLAKPHKTQRHHKEYDDDEDSEPYYRKDKHTSEHVVYHKDEEPTHVHYHKEHHEPKRVDHFHHYDKQHAQKTEHIHYQQHNPQPLRTTEILAPAATQLVTRRRRPSRVLYAAAPNSVFHTQINVQSQDSELNSQVRPDPVLVAAQLPVAGAQLPAAALPNCQFPVAGNPPIGCRALDPAGGQLGANAFPAGGQLPAGGLPAGGQLGANAFPAGGQLGANAFPAGGQLGANALPAGGQLGTNAFPAGGQLGANAFSAGGQLGANAFPVGAQLQAGANLGNGNGNGNGNFFVDPSLGAQLGAGQAANNGNQNGQGFGNQNLFNPAVGGQLAGLGQPQRPTAVLIQVDPALGAQLPVSAQAPILGGQLGANQNPILGGQLGANQNPILGGQLGANQAPGGQQNLFDPIANGQLTARRLNAARRNGRRLRANYQGVNVVNGNVFGQPQLQGPTNAVGNQQDTNIIDGNYYSYPGQHSQLVRVNGNRRAVLLTDGDYDDDYDTDIGLAASSPELTYAVPERRSARKLRASKQSTDLEQGTAASEQQEKEYLNRNK